MSLAKISCLPTPRSALQPAPFETRENEPAVQRIEHQGFLLLLVAVTLAFAWVLQPFYGAVLWAIVVAVIFAPVYRRLLAAMNGRQSLAAAVTVLIIIAIVILPLAMVATSLVAGGNGPGHENPVGGIQFRQLPAADTRRTAGLGDRADRALQPHGFLRLARTAQGRPDEGRAGSGPAGAQHRDEHVRLRDQVRHHALSAVLPVA